MFTKRVWYLTALMVCAAVYVATGAWLAWILLIWLAGLPWFSLLLSLPAILQFRLSPTGTDCLTRGEAGTLWLLGSCPVPMPPFRGRIRLLDCGSGAASWYDPEKGVPAAHCGCIRASVMKDRVCDYLGLFSFRVRQKEEQTILVRPTPVEAALPDLQQYAARRWHAKPGGGYSENHELRDYRPGDSMNGVHWKLSAKTGSLMVREPMEPDQGLALLTMTVRGTPEELDRKFGRLLWVGEYLLSKDVTFEIRALTGDGIFSLPVSDGAALKKGIDTLLRAKAADAGSIEDQAYEAAWQFHIGGEQDAV